MNSREASEILLKEATKTAYTVAIIGYVLGFLSGIVLILLIFYT